MEDEIYLTGTKVKVMENPPKIPRVHTGKSYIFWIAEMNFRCSQIGTVVEYNSYFKTYTVKFADGRSNCFLKDWLTRVE